MKHILLSILLITAVHFSFAQNTAYFTFNSECYMMDKMIKTSDNNYVGVASYAYGKVIAKWDALFNVLWLKKMTDRPNIDFLDMVETNSGNYVFLADNVDSSFVYKFSKQGALLQSKYFTSGSVAYFTPNNLSNAISGDGVVMTGGFCNVENYFIRLDDNLNVVWQYKYKDGTSTCANSRASDIITESNKYVYAFNPSGGGVDLIAIDDNGNIINTSYFGLALQATGFPIQLKKLSNGAYVGTWESVVHTNGTEFIYFDSTHTKATCRNYNLGAFYSLQDYLEYDKNKIIIGGTVQPITNGNQSNMLFAVDNNGMLQWSKTSEGVNNQNAAEQIKCFAHGLDNSIFAFGGAGLDGMYGAKLNYSGNGFCTSANYTTTIKTSDSISAVNKTITRNSLIALTIGNIAVATKDTTFSAAVECGVLDNSPLSISANENNRSQKVYPNPTTAIVNVELENAKAFQFAVFNIQGIAMGVPTTIVNYNLVQCHLSNLPNGIYYLHASSSKTNQVFKLIKN